MPHKTPKIAIVGRTNVGKSTLFNKLIEEQKSLVSAIAGTTRDRFEGDCIWRGRVIKLIDTGGLNIDAKDEMDQNIYEQAFKAIEEADLVMFVVDLQAGLQQEDRDLADQIQKLNKPTVVVGNKADNGQVKQNAHNKEWYSWSLGAPLPVSAKHGRGSGDLLDAIYHLLDEEKIPVAEIQDLATIRVTVLGKPNAGKSSLLNALIGEDRFIASSMEHTTREPNDVHISVNDHDYLFVDTAGVRKLAKVRSGKSKLEKAGVSKTMISLKRSDVTLFVLDISKEIQTQDRVIAGKIAEAGTSAIIIANKWDLIPDKDPNTINAYEEYIRRHLPMLKYAPIVFTSAITKKRVPGLFEVIDKVFQSRFTQLSEEETKGFISWAIKKHKPSRGKGIAHPHIMSFRQSAVNPPLFDLKIRHVRKDVLAESYLRFLANLMRQQYDFEGTPIRIRVLTKKKSHTT